MTNTNCLEGMRCPNIECQSEGPFRISVNVMVEMWDDGSEGISGDIEYDSSNYCQCVSCGDCGNVGGFRIKNQNWWPIPAHVQCENEAHIFDFDATRFFEQATDEELLKQMDANFEGEGIFPIVNFMQDLHHELEALISYSEHTEVGYWGWVDIEQGKSWIKEHRPHLVKP